MTKILGTLALHRFLLFLVAMFAVYQSFPPGTSSSEVTFSRMTRRFFERVAERPGTRSLLQSARYAPHDLFDALRSPFVSMYRGLLALTRLEPLTGAILITNLFFFLFLLELYGMWGRIHPASEAAAAATLVILLPTSFEMSLVSSFAFTCFLVTLAVHRALSNKWLVAGAAMGILTLIDALNLVLLPLLIYLFFYFHQGQVFRTVWRRCVLFLLPVIIAVILDWRSFSEIWGTLRSSTFFYLVDTISGTGLKQTIEHSPFMTTLVLLTLLLGAVGAFLNNKNFVDKIIPASMLLFVLLTSPFALVPFRVPLAGVCLHGVIQLTGKPVMWILYAVMFALAAMAVFAIFGPGYGY